MWKRGQLERKLCAHSEISAGLSKTPCQPECVAASGRKLPRLASTAMGRAREGEEGAKITRFGRWAGPEQPWKVTTTNHMQKEEAGLASLLKRMSFYYLSKSKSQNSMCDRLRQVT